MSDFNTCRENAIKQQIRPWGGLNSNANNALNNIPREVFVPQNHRDLAFADMAIPLGDNDLNGFMLPPKIEGRALDALCITNKDKVLEIGTGSGYLTAVMSTLARSVTSIDINETVSTNTAEKLARFNITNVNLIVGDALNTSNKAINKKFDVIMFGASVSTLPTAYRQKLTIGGRLFVAEGVGHCMCAKLIVRLDKKNYHTQSLFETYLAPLRGGEITPHFQF